MNSSQEPATVDWDFSIALQGDDSSIASTPSEPPPELIEAFRNDGFVALSNVLSKEAVSALNDRLEHVLRGNFDRGKAPDKTPRLVKTPYRAQTTKPLGFSGNLQNVKVQQIVNIRNSDSLFSQLACNTNLARLVGQLAGWQRQGTRLAQDQVWAKPPAAAPLVFHRDSAYFMFDPTDVVTVWIALDDMDAELGPLEYVRGSHKWGDARWGSTSQFFQPNAGGKKLLHTAAVENGILPENEGDKTCEEACQALDIVSMAGLKAGGISIHNGRTWHGSGKNQSTCRPRRGLGLHFVPGNVRFTSEAAKSKLWKPYIERKTYGSNDGFEVPIDDFPITWQPSSEHKTPIRRF